MKEIRKWVGAEYAALNAHAEKLRNERYITKRYIEDAPYRGARKTYAITAEGRDALEKYLAAMSDLVEAVGRGGTC